MDATRVRVERDTKKWPDRLRAYKVVLDGSVVGRLKRGESLLLDTLPGHHELHLAIDWCRSPRLDLELSAGEVIHVRCWPNADVHAMMYWGIFGRKRYIGIEITT